MNHNITSDLDQAEEDMLTYDVSDEELEAAAGIVKGTTCSLKSLSCCFGC
jgi:hypothetical protein